MDKMSVHGSVFSVYWIYYQSQKIPTFLVCNSFVSTILESSPPTFFPVSFLLLEKTFGRQRDGVPNKVLLSFLFQKKRKPFFKAKPLGLAYFVTVLGLIDKYLEQRPNINRELSLWMLFLFLLLLFKVLLWKRSLEGNGCGSCWMLADIFLEAEVWKALWFSLQAEICRCLKTPKNPL